MTTIQELLELGRNKLNQSGNEYARYEGRVLLEEVLGQSHLYLLMNGGGQVTTEQEKAYLDLLEKRCSHYPLQYMLGYAHFMDYTFFVDENVLIPRSDTEILTELAKERIEKRGGRLHVLDLCCGSGCIGISLKLYFENIHLVLSDLSEGALRVAQKNLEKYGTNAELNQGDLFEGISDRVDLIVCNPPYIRTDEIASLMPEVRDYEPGLALDGGQDGLSLYRRIIEEAGEHLSPKGELIFEIGYNQGADVSSMMLEAHFHSVEVRKDYSGLDRVVYGHL